RGSFRSRSTEFPVSPFHAFHLTSVNFANNQLAVSDPSTKSNSVWNIGHNTWQPDFQQSRMSYDQNVRILPGSFRYHSVHKSLESTLNVEKTLTPLGACVMISLLVPRFFQCG